MKDNINKFVQTEYTNVSEQIKTCTDCFMNKKHLKEVQKNGEKNSYLTKDVK